MILDYVYDGDDLPVEIWHLAGRGATTLCGIDTLPLKWRVTGQEPISGKCCEACSQFASEGLGRLRDLVSGRGSS